MSNVISITCLSKSKEHDSIEALKKNLEELQALHERLNFMLKELEELVGETG